MTDALAMLDHDGLLAGRYRLDRPVGRGSNGDVWKATDVRSGATVAVKLLRTCAGHFDAERYLRNVRLAASLDTEHVAEVFDFGVVGGEHPYLVTELLRGETLARRLDREGRLRPETLVPILEQIVDALCVAHASGVVHGGLEPSNVVLEPDEHDAVRVRVIEFGIGASFDPFDSGASGIEVEGPSRSAASTLGHRAPEQIRGDHDPGPAADVWALGVMTYTALTGRRPFVADSLEDLAKVIATGTCPPAHEVFRGLPESFDAWFRNVCDLEPARRPTDLRKMAKDLRALLPTVDD